MTQPTVPYHIRATQSALPPTARILAGCATPAVTDRFYSLSYVTPTDTEARAETAARTTPTTTAFTIPLPQATPTLYGVYTADTRYPAGLQPPHGRTTDAVAPPVMTPALPAVPTALQTAPESVQTISQHLRAAYETGMAVSGSVPAQRPSYGQIERACQQIEWRQDSQSVAAELLAAFIRTHALPNTNHRSTLTLVSLYFQTLTDATALPAVRATNPDFAAACTRFIRNSKRLRTLHRRFTLCRILARHGIRGVERKYGVTVPLTPLWTTTPAMTAVTDTPPVGLPTETPPPIAAAYRDRAAIADDYQALCQAFIAAYCEATTATGREADAGQRTFAARLPATARVTRAFAAHLASLDD